MMQPQNGMDLGTDRMPGPVDDGSTVLPEAPPERATEARRRIPWFTVVVATIALIAIATAAVLAVARSSLTRDLAATRVELDGANHRVTDAQTQADGLRQQVEGTRSQLDDANAATRNVRESLTACQDLFRAGLNIGSRPPTPGEATNAASDLVSCFEGEIPQSMFP